MRRLLTSILLLCTLGAVAQQRTVSGTVRQKETGLPLAGATVKSSLQTIATDSLGRFQVLTKTGEYLQVTYVGMIPATAKVPATGTMAFVLTPSSTDLTQIVVTGYQSQRKADLTGAVSVVDVGELKKQAVANPIKALQGEVAGVFISSNGSPSAPATIRIRGIGTLNDNDPLFIIDGVPTKAGMHELNPNDIESMQVLKDASAASIYGSRAANGVIIITTKQGKAGRVQVSANAYTATQFYTTSPQMLNAGGYGQAYWQAAVNSGRDPNVNNIAYRFQWHADNSGKPMLDKILLPAYLDAAHTMHASNTDWFDAISKQGLIQAYDISISNGTEKGNYLFSAGYFDNQGVVKTTGFNRLSARMNASYKLIDGRLTIGENFTINRTREVIDPGVLNLALQALPIVPVHTVT